jgi:hypothetical protein
MIWTSNKDFYKEQQLILLRRREAIWHRYFAWHPVRIGTDRKTASPVMAWLIYVERKRTYSPAKICGPPGSTYWRGGFTSDEYRRYKNGCS